MRGPIATILELPVEVVQQVTHELMGVLLLITPSIQTNKLKINKNIFQAVTTAASEDINLKLGIIFHIV